MKNFFKKIVIWIITLEAKLTLKKYSPKIVAITGSVGKTSAKDAIYTIMSGFVETGKSEKSFNSEIGIPLTILGEKNAWSNIFLWAWNIIRGFFLVIFPFRYPKWLILEVGADKPGDIESVSKWLKTDVVVMTRMAEIPVHIENFKDKEEVAKEKSFLKDTLKENGVLILNNDDAIFSELKNKTKKQVITFGFEKGADILASDYHLSYEKEGDLAPQGISFKIEYNGNNFPVRLNNIFGKQNVYASMSAFAVGISQKFNFIKMIELLEKHKSPQGRFNMLLGIGNTLIIDDTYNSSPIALEMAIQSVSEIKNNGRKIAVLGDMLELGSYSEEAHRKIGEMIPSVFDFLIVVGDKAKFFAEGAKSKGMEEEKIRYFPDSKEASFFVKGILNSRDAVLVKGSQSIRMERIVSQIVTEEEKIAGKIVRQDKEWLDKN